MNTTSLVLKVASRCNLNCSYCYVYNQGDTTYLSQPKFMAKETVDILIDRVIEHCVAYDLKHFTFIFHGGEPLLLTMDFYSYFVNRANLLCLKNNIKCSFALQTNGLFITKEWCELFNNLKINIGISIDGYKEVNDKFRVDHKGRGSFDRIIKGFEVAQKHLEVKPGILSVIDVSSNPLKFYQTITNLNVKFFDLLWPHSNYEQLPDGYNDINEGECKTLYADWLITIFDVWFSQKAENNIHITIFDTIIDLILNKEYASNEDFGSGDNKLLVIEANGDIEVVGALKLCGHGFTKNGADIATSSLSGALNTKLAKVYYKSHSFLNKKCRKCPIVEICGGGHVHTRYKKENGFNNVSVYCHDFLKLIIYIQNTMYESMPQKYKDQWNKIDYEEVSSYLKNLDFDSIEDSEYTQELISFRS